MMAKVLDRVRWKTLSATLAPGLVGTGLAVADSGLLSFFPFLCCGISAFLIQIGTNLVNDALDSKNGIDGAKRLGPRRLTGNASPALFYFTGVGCFPLAILISLPAILLRGISLFWVEVTCCLAGYAYTGGPFPLAYYALGDVTVFIFFGLVETANAKFLHQGGSMFAMDSVIAGMQVGVMAVNILAVNNLRDIESDSKSGKRTLSNLLGYEIGRWQLVFNVLFAHASGFCWLYHGHKLAFLLPLTTLPYAAYLISQVFDTKPSVRYNHFLQQWSLLHVLFSFALMMGLMLSRLFV